MHYLLLKEFREEDLDKLIIDIYEWMNWLQQGVTTPFKGEIAIDKLGCLWNK